MKWLLFLIYPFLQDAKEADWKENGRRRTMVGIVMNDFPQIGKHIVSSGQFTHFIGSMNGKDFRPGPDRTYVVG